MTIWNILYTILIMPLQLFFEVVYVVADKLIDNPGLSIIVLSLAINFLVLPLYRRADAMQEEERDMEKKLHAGVKHIKKTFKGDERMMILQTYYRQNNYRPTDVFKGSISLFLEIPFFIAAYHFLSHLGALEGVSFGVIRDLGAPDGLLTIAGHSINVLPFIMTAVNLVSCIIFTKGHPLKTKIQLYSMAIFFLIFLYTSPSGLVFYWTLNNVFSLVKTIFYKLKNPKQIVFILFAAVGAIIAGYGLFAYESESWKRELAVPAVGFVMMLPLIWMLIQKLTGLKWKKPEIKPNPRLFFICGIYMAVLVGLLIPSFVIKDSPQEFVDVFYYRNPLWYLVSSGGLAIGTFIIWFGVFYWLMKKENKFFFEYGMLGLCIIATINYMGFGKKLGVISPSLEYANGINYTWQEQLLNFAVLGVVLVAVLLLLLRVKFVKKNIHQLALIGAAALFVIGMRNVVVVAKEVKSSNYALEQMKVNDPQFTLSTSGKNVVVIMMDKAMNEYIPYIMNEKPELMESFAGFTYYSNVISYGCSTNFGSPPLYGGYEYTPVEMNIRDTESLQSKQNEALLVMPVIFEQNDYQVTVCEPTYANYKWVPDLSIYDEYPDIHTCITKGAFYDEEQKQEVINNNSRNFFCYGLLKVAPLTAQSLIYDYGNYNMAEGSNALTSQKRNGLYMADGKMVSFMESYNVLDQFPEMTKIEDSETNTFMMISNEATHDVMYLQEPEYVPVSHVDNTQYELENSDRYTVNGVTLNMTIEEHFRLYQSNMGSMLKLAEWLDYLKEQGVYDNTRIIIVADHGCPPYQMDHLVLNPDGGIWYDLEYYYPLLMVKDFNSQEFTTSEEFMTNGDVPTLAFEGLIDNPINPSTGNPITNDEKYEHPQYVFASAEWNVYENNGNTFIPKGVWFSVQDDMRKLENWQVLNSNATLPDVSEDELR